MPIRGVVLKEDDMYVVTGGTGFIGSNIIAQLETKGMGPIVVIDRLRKTNKWRNISKNVSLPLEIMGYNRSEISSRVKKVLELVELTGFEKKFPWQLSGGMQQRASIARALSFNADILLMDEPFGALDEIVRDHLNEQLLKLWKSTNKTICFVTHSIPEAVYLSTKIVVMSPRPGRIIDIIDSPLPNERPLEIRDSAEFLTVSQRVREGLRSGHSYE